MIFEDASGRRRTWVFLTAAAAVAMLAVPLVLSHAAEQLPSTRTPWPRATATALPTPATWSDDAPVATAPPPGRADAALDLALQRLDAPLPLPAGAHLAFTVDDPRAHASVAQHRDAIAAVAPDWFRVVGDDCELEVLPEADLGPRDAEALWLPRVANFDGNAWTARETSALLRDVDARHCLADALARELAARDADGVNVDFESLAAADASNLVHFVLALRERLHPLGMRVTIDVAANDPAFDLPRLGRAADAVVLMAYDQHHDHGAPGPIAARDWLAAAIDRARAQVPAEHLVVALGSYCYDWPAQPGATARARTMPEAFALAAELGAQPQTIAGTGNLRFDWQDPEGVAHQVWCLDAVALADALALLHARGLDRTALWRAGSEDPSWWPVLQAEGVDARARALQSIEPEGAAIVEGSGDVILRRVAARGGRRELALASDGSVVHSRMPEVPSVAVLERRGSGDGVVLSFDDGPDPRWTPALLDALAQVGAPATFFVLGEAAREHPALVQRMQREGHVVANHSWDHADPAMLDHEAMRAQLASTSRLLEALTGREVQLYRAPYGGVLDLDDAAAVARQHDVWASGHAYVSSSVDAADWADDDADAIVRRVLAQVEAGGRVVVMHDGGGDRSATLAAVRALVPELRRRGHPVVGLDDYLGISRETLAPPLAGRDRVFATVNRALAWAREHTDTVLAWVFGLCTALAGLRIVALATLVLRDARRAPPRPHPGRPLVTVLLPSYNEGKVIAASIESLLAGSYRELEILVIDDGSTDDTAEVANRIAAVEPRVRCIRKANGGKASAANLGIRHARGEIVIAVDADTVVAPDAIARMVDHFADARVDAVCGNVEVGNVRSALTAFQAIEYVTSQNFDRRAFAALNCIGVVPGALGAWRRSALLDAGGYSHDTLVEDADLTLGLLRRGGVITYEPRAIGRTEAPESLGALWKQRFRWTYGTYQCLAKHRAALLRGTLGWVALPNVLVFQVLFPLVSPIGDAALVLALVSGSWSAVLSGYLGFLAMDLIASVLAFRLDRKPLRWLPLLLIQRFTYRQFLYLVSARAMLAVLLGSRHGWRKLERTASVVPLPTRAAPTLERAA
ncbi:MAG: glycosyltransferase [Nannocystaceae bacterium]|nr:glycosyltransferase [Nannocystaceae bacterium]